MNLSDRPIIDRWRAAPWVAQTPIDDHTVGSILRDEVQIAFRGDGPMSKRELVPLTAGAHELLYGSQRDSAHRVIRGMLATLDGVEGAANLRGMSMASDEGAFATNLLLSNTEAGFFPDSVGAGDPAGFERSMVSLIPSVKTAKAQNTGWMDLGPRLTGHLKAIIEQGPEVGSAPATEMALTFLHELQHSVSPHDPNTIQDKHVWLEEGIAETLAWWPGRAAAMRERMGVPPRAGETIDPWSVPPDSVASQQYRSYHRSVQELLGLAGVTPYREDGTIDPDAYARASQLLQADTVDRVPRALARAIVDEHGIDPANVDAITELVTDTAGDPESVAALEAALGIRS